ncbi:hypothetical protein [Streptomyces sp. NPDC005760]|uniref:peptidoglycan-binding domain-containing protein n=1 Tax=Streptomyces sp. NPDC005760 TaxID=3156718 RepID=UPI0034042431
MSERSDRSRRAADNGLSQKRKWVAAVAVAEADPPQQGVLTAPVENRVLKDSVIIRGTVVAGQSVDVAPSGSGGEATTSAVVTKAPKAVGTEIKAGQVLVEISGHPVFALKGRVPVYRDLKPGSTGDDVAQLQSALGALGHGTGSGARGTSPSSSSPSPARWVPSAG